MNRISVVCLAVCFALGLSRIGHTWSFGAELKSTVNKNQNSNNNNSVNDSVIKVDKSDNKSYKNSFNKSYDYSDNSKTDNSNKVTDSYNTDSHNFTDYTNKSVTDSHAITDSYKSTDSHAISDSYNGDYDYSSGKTVDSYNGDRRSYNVSGDVTKSVIGDFNQKTVGTDFGGGLTVSGSGNTIGGATSVSNTFGDVHVSSGGDK